MGSESFIIPFPFQPPRSEYIQAKERNSQFDWDIYYFSIHYYGDLSVFLFFSFFFLGGGFFRLVENRCFFVCFFFRFFRGGFTRFVVFFGHLCLIMFLSFLCLMLDLDILQIFQATLP